MTVCGLIYNMKKVAKIYTSRETKKTVRKSVDFVVNPVFTFARRISARTSGTNDETSDDFSAFECAGPASSNTAA